MSEYLVDTSVWIEFLRGNSVAVKKRLETLLDTNRATVTGIILAELLIGINRKADQAFIEDCFQGLPFLETSGKIYAEAGKMGSRLRRMGLTVPLSDILIAALARAHGLTVLTLDNHFQVLARPLGVQMELLKGF